MMRALIVSEFGGAAAVGEAQKPEPGEGEIRVRVAAVGVNFADTLIIAGKYQERQEPPIIPGLELSGVVDAVGNGALIDGRKPVLGERVAAMGSRAMAEYAIVDARMAAPLPEAVSFEHGAAAPIAYGTGLIALEDRARLAPGERLLVTGAAGGAGLTAIELGGLLGAEVFGAARGAEKCAQVAAKGARAFDTAQIDLKTELKALGGVDVVYETVGGEIWDAAFRAARPGGRLLPIGFAGGEAPQIPANILMVKNLTVIGFYWGGWIRHAPQSFGGALRRIFDWIAEGRLQPQVTAYPMAEGEAALSALRERRAVGKIVVTP